MIRNCVLMLDILLPKHIPNRPHVWNINMFPNNDPSITLAYMHNYSCVHAYAHCCIAQEDTLYTSYIDWKQVTYCSFSQIRKPGLFNPVQIFNPQISTMTSKYHQLISSIQQGIAGPPGPVQQHHADGYLHRRRAGRHLAARAAAKVLDTGGGEARRLVFFGRLDKNEGYKKHGKAGKSLKKLGKRGGCFEFID